MHVIENLLIFTNLDVNTAFLEGWVGSWNQLIVFLLIQMGLIHLPYELFGFWTNIWNELNSYIDVPLYIITWKIIANYY